MGLSDSGCCFACGPRNPIGLHLEFRIEGDDYVTEFTPSPWHQGFSGIVHGGILSTLLDEVMARNLWVRDMHAATAELKVSFHLPARTEEPLTVVARITRDRGRLILCEARAQRADGTVVASAEGKFLRIPDA